MILMLHSHIPYVKHQGRWPFGEVWLFEAMAETYIPLLDMLNRLVQDGIQPGIAVSLSPTLLDQLESPYIHQAFEKYLTDCECLAAADKRHYAAMGEESLSRMAAYYERVYAGIKMKFMIVYNQDLIAAFNRLQESSSIEIVATAATHAYLPLVDERSVQAQVHLGKMSYEKHFGRQACSFWLPECGYKDGLEQALLECGFRNFFVDSHAVEGGRPQGDSSPSNSEMTADIEFFAETGLSTYRPYYVKGRDLVVLGRNAMISQQVWSADSGYPGDADYREFHLRSPRSGLKYWRVTERKHAGQKQYYDPAKASRRAVEHAAHFVESVGNTIFHARKIGVEQPLIVGCYDTELFGHWWWEGILWLETVLRLINSRSGLKLQLPSRVEAPRQEANLFESSWGMGGKHFIWQNEETVWMWELAAEASNAFWEIWMKKNGGGKEKRIVDQALKELLLLESSDWFFMVSNNLTRDYAMHRFFEHYARLHRLLAEEEAGNISSEFEDWMKSLEHRDDFLSGLDYDTVRRAIQNRGAAC